MSAPNLEPSLSVLESVVVLANHDREFDKAVQEILERIVGIDGCVGGALGLPEWADRSQLRRHTEVFEGDSGISKEVSRVGKPILHRVYRTGKSEWDQDPGENPFPLISDHTTPAWTIPPSLFTTPVVVNNRVEGVLQVYWERDPDQTGRRESVSVIVACQIARLLEREIKTTSFLRLNELHRILVENVIDHAIFLIDPKGRVMTWNKGAERIKGYTAPEIIGEDYAKFFTQEDRNRGLPERLLELAQRRGRIEEQGWRVRANGHLFYSTSTLSALSDENGALTGFLKITHDITEKRNLEREIVRVGIQHQREVAQQLHDGIGQDLTGMVMLSSLLKRKLKAAGVGEAEDAARLEEAASRAQNELRRVSRGLHPVDVSEEGLVHALEELLRETESLCGVSTESQVSGAIEIQDNDVATHLFYIAKEALNNEIRHGKATSVKIELDCTNHRFSMKISGNGTGIAPDREISRGIGLSTMSHRANLLGGVLRIEPGEQAGTVVTCLLDLDGSPGSFFGEEECPS